jgi:hypothetical protein
MVEYRHGNGNNNAKTACPPPQFVSANLAPHRTSLGPRPNDGVDVFFGVWGRQTVSSRIVGGLQHDAGYRPGASTGYRRLHGRLWASR